MLFLARRSSRNIPSGGRHAWRRLLPFVSLTCLATASLACVVHTQGGWKNDVADGQHPPATETPGAARPEMDCEAYCSSDRIGVSSLRLHLPAQAKAVVEPDRARLDWTIYKGGFENGAYQSFEGLEPGSTSSVEDAGAAYRQSDRRGLRLTAVDRREDGDLTLAVEGLEPGLLYRWRLRTRDGQRWTTAATAACGASVCPADWVDENDELKRVPR